MAGEGPRPAEDQGDHPHPFLLVEEAEAEARLEGEDHLAVEVPQVVEDHQEVEGADPLPQGA